MEPLPVSWLEIRHFAALITHAQTEVYAGYADGKEENVSGDEHTGLLRVTW